MKSFEDFLEKRFPDSRRKAYYLMAIHENLTRVPKQQLREIGWTKARELAKVARREGQGFESAPWVHKAQELPKEEFKREVDRHLTGRNTEASELVYFRLFKSQLAAIEQALETASLMLGFRQVPGLRPRNDLRGFPGWSQFAGRQSRHSGSGRSPARRDAANRTKRAGSSRRGRNIRSRAVPKQGRKQLAPEAYPVIATGDPAA